MNAQMAERFESAPPPTVAQRLDALPITSVHRDLVARLGAGLFVDGFDVYLAAGVAATLLKSGFASLDQIAALVSFTFIGLAVGGMSAGVLADRFGRRRMLACTLSLVIIGSLGAATSTSMIQLIAWRMLTALGLGGETVLAYATAMEFVPPSVRGRWLAVLGLMANIATPVALGVGFLLLPLPFGWRWMLILAAVAAIIVLFLRRRLPESPRWLASRGEHDAADRIVREIETAAGAKKAAFVVPPSHEAAIASAGAAQQSVFHRVHRRNLIVGSAVNIAVMSAVFGFINWLPSFFAKAGYDITASLGFSALMAMGSPIGVLLGLAISDRIERKVGIVIFSLAAVAFGFGYAFASSAVAIATLGFLVVAFVYVVGALGMTAYVPELFPTRIRMSGVGFCTTMGRIAAIGMPFVVVALFTRAGQAAVIGLIASILFVQAMLVAWLGIRTNGRPLEAS